MIDLKLIPYIIALSFTALVVLLGVLIYLLFKKQQDKQLPHIQQLLELLEENDSSESVSATTSNVNIFNKWNYYWARLVENAGIGRYAENASQSGRDMAVFFVVSGLIVGLLFKQPLLALFIPVILCISTASFLQMLHNKQAESLSKQLPGLLFAVKSNLQSGDTNERALMKVVDSMPEPLYSDLVVAKNVLNANGTFKEALQTLSYHTSSKDLQFLCSCMIQASEAGSNMSNQIDAIQEVLKARQQVNYTIAKAVKAVTPAVLISTFAIPSVFIASLLIDSSAKKFWFVDPLSYVALALVVFLYVAGIWLSKKQVNKIKNM